MVSCVKSILAVAMLAMLVGTGYAIQCYQCESTLNNKCGEKFEADKNMLIDCSLFGPPAFLRAIFPGRNATGCMKKTIEGLPGKPNIVRSCYFGDINNFASGCQADPALPFVKQLSCDVCTKEMCNGSGSIAPIAGAILLFFGIARFLA